MAGSYILERDFVHWQWLLFVHMVCLVSTRFTKKLCKFGNGIKTGVSEYMNWCHLSFLTSILEPLSAWFVIIACFHKLSDESTLFVVVIDIMSLMPSIQLNLLNPDHYFNIMSDRHASVFSEDCGGKIVLQSIMHSLLQS